LTNSLAFTPKLVYGMNRCILDGMLTEIDGTGKRAVLDPRKGYCLVRLHPS
jgi:hypothetical protein